MINRHKVFISYYHNDDQYYKDELVKMTIKDEEKNKMVTVFEDYSVANGDIKEGLPAETIRRKIRDEFIQDATVLILLCGEHTKGRKYIDWELHAAMYNTTKNPRMGIIVINLPTINQNIRVADGSEKELVSPKSKWEHVNNRQVLEEKYQYMPSRIIDNFEKDVPITVVNWNRIISKPSILLRLIDNAYNRKDLIEYDTHALLRKNNSKI